MGVILAGCGPPKPAGPPSEPPAPRKNGATISGVARGIRLTRDDAHGRPLYVIEGRASTQSQTDQNVIVSGTTVTLYDEGAPVMIVRSPNTKVRGDTRELVMWGGISASMPRDRATLKVERLTWSAETRQFTGSGGARFTQPPIAMLAETISGKTPVKKVNLDGGVTMTVTP